MSNPLTQSDIDQLEVFADKLFAKVGIDVEFTRHFLDRVNDQRNKKQITMGELTRLFKQEYRKWGKPIAKLGPDAEAVMKDLQTDINLPFALRWDAKNNELDLIAKTVMRKKDFKTSNQEFAVEDTLEENPLFFALMRAAGMAGRAIKNPGMSGAAGGAATAAYSKIKDMRKDDDELTPAKVDRPEPSPASAVNLPKIKDIDPDTMGNYAPKKSKRSGVREERKIKNPMEKQVEVRGLGVYSVGGLQKNIASKLRELADKAERGDPSSFRQINYLMNNGVMDAMLEGLINAYDDLARQTIYRREFGEGIDKENAPYSDRDVKHMYEKWSEKYKKSIDCDNPKGFSQKAHCAGRKKR